MYKRVQSLCTFAHTRLLSCLPFSILFCFPKLTEPPRRLLRGVSRSTCGFCLRTEVKFPSSGSRTACVPGPSQGLCLSSPLSCEHLEGKPSGPSPTATSVFITLNPLFPPTWSGCHHWCPGLWQDCFSLLSLPPAPSPRGTNWALLPRPHSTPLQGLPMPVSTPNASKPDRTRTRLHSSVSKSPLHPLAPTTWWF